MKKLINIFFGILIITVILMFAAFIFIIKGDYLNFKLNEESKIILIEKGDNLRKLSNKLEIEGIYEENLFSYLVLKIIAGNTPLHVGEYEITRGETIIDFANKIKNKIHYYRKITFIEGDTITKYKAQIEEAYGLQGIITEQLSEGYFMPGTYKYLYGETKNSIIARAKNEMLDFVAKEFSIVNKEGFYLKNIHEVLSLASVVEKESGIGIERKLIAGVFFNRLKQGMKLQSDPTTIYEITKGRYKLERALTYNDLAMKGEYNTYYIKGIPIAPIANPGKEAIMATLYPQKTESLFFVATGEGGHNFASNFEEHKENIKKYKETLKNKNETRK